jgi:hypothetical protein
MFQVNSLTRGLILWRNMNLCLKPNTLCRLHLSRDAQCQCSDVRHRAAVA